MTSGGWWIPARALVVAVAALGLFQAVGMSERMEQGAGTDKHWAPTRLTEPVRRVFAAGGALVATTDAQLLRSDDAGGHWSPVTLPTDSTIAAVDPTDPRILYAASAAGLYRTADEGASWQLSLGYAPEVSTEPGRLAVSAADHDRLYLALKQAPGPTSALRLLRSRDGGRIWQPLQADESSQCEWSVLLLQPQPTNADRLFRATVCIAGRTFGASLEQSTDAGASWVAVYNAEPYRTPELGYPTLLVGGQGDAPGRYYLATNRDARIGGSSLVRSDDDANTWTEVLAFHGGGTPGYRRAEDPADAPNTRIGGLVVDAADTDRIYVGLLVYDEYPPEQPVGGGVLVSTDGGASWAPLGQQNLGGVNALVFSAEDQSLYAATGQGLWRLVPAE
jgi:photosystem II stability/assembly factor-like uncharacterized protein